MAREMTAARRRSEAHRDEHAGSSGRSRSDEPLEDDGPLERFFTRLVDVGLGVVVFLFPLMLGGNPAPARLVLIGVTCATAFAWCLRQALRPRGGLVWSGAEWLIALAAGLLFVQSSPLPDWMLHTLAPATPHNLPTWDPASESAVHLGHWPVLSLAPGSTRLALGMLGAYGLLFFVTLQRIRRTADLERMVLWIGGTAAVMATFGLVQYATSNGKFLWIFDHPYTDTLDRVKGAFGNRNHFAHLLALGLGPLIYWALQVFSEKPTNAGRFGAAPERGARDVRVGMALFCVAIVIFAGLLTLSRGGTIALFVATLVTVGLLYRQGKLSPTFAVGLVGLGLLVGVFLFVHGQDQVTGRLSDFFEGDVESIDKKGGRRTIWAAVFAGAADYPVLGTGVGSHREVYPIYYAGTRETEYAHAESGFFQLLLETGAAGMLLMLIGIACCAMWCVATLRRGTNSRALGCTAAIAGSLAANVVHSVGDVMWYVPGCMVLVVILCACACRAWQLSGGSPTAGRIFAFPRTGWLGGAVAAAALAWAILPGWVARSLGEPHWNQYLRLVLKKDVPEEEEPAPSDPKAQAAQLVSLLKVDPEHYRGHLRLARLYLLQFQRLQAKTEAPLNVEQLRDASIASEFASAEERDAWLARAVGSNRKYLDAALKHSRRSLELAPTQADGYLYLAKLAFLEGGGTEEVNAYLEQAVRVRPHDGHVLYAVGKEKFLAGDLEAAIVYWKQSFKSDRSQAARLIALLAGRVDAQFFIAGFEPDVDELQMLVDAYRPLNLPNDFATLGRKLIEVKHAETGDETGADSARNWMLSYKLAVEMNDVGLAVACLQRGVQADPQDFDNRQILGTVLFRAGDYAGAATHINWCLQRRPKDVKLRALADRIARGPATPGIQPPGVQPANFESRFQRPAFTPTAGNPYSPR